MKGLHSGVFFLAGNFINYSAFRILRIQMFYRVESESFTNKGFKIDTKNGQRKSIRFMFRFAGRKILQGQQTQNDR